MTVEQIVFGTAACIFLCTWAYAHSGFKKVKQCFGMLFHRQYWVSYNTVEFFSYATKVIIIVPGLIFGVQIWWLYFFTLATSLTLIWASNKKMLPTLLGFNTVWAFISCMVLAQHLI